MSGRGPEPGHLALDLQGQAPWVPLRLWLAGPAEKGRGGQGLLHYAAPKEGLGCPRDSDGPENARTQGGGSGRPGRGFWPARPGRCCRQLEAQQAKVMHTAEPPALPCPAHTAKAQRMRRQAPREHPWGNRPRKQSPGVTRTSQTRRRTGNHGQSLPGGLSSVAAHYLRCRSASASLTGPVAPGPRQGGACPGAAILTTGDFPAGAGLGAELQGRLKRSIPRLCPRPPNQNFWGWSQELRTVQMLPEGSEEGGHTHPGPGEPVLQVQVLWF